MPVRCERISVHVEQIEIDEHPPRISRRFKKAQGEQDGPGRYNQLAHPRPGRSRGQRSKQRRLPRRGQPGAPATQAYGVRGVGLDSSAIALRNIPTRGSLWVADHRQ
eukprot:scaffold90929_cov30-Tisochrysis_lutea.AAC.10